MIQPLFNGMLALVLAKFVMNDLPHSAGLLADHRDTDKPTPGQLHYIASLCQRLGITIPYEERVKSFGEAGRLIRELEAEVEHRRKLKGSSSSSAEAQPKLFTAEVLGEIDDVIVAYPGLDALVKEWIAPGEQATLQEIVSYVSKNPEVRESIQDILRKHFGDEILVFRGGYIPERGIISTTVWRGFAEERGSVTPFLVKTSDVIMAIPTSEQELLVDVIRATRLEGGNPSPAQYGTCYVDAWRYLIKQDEGYLVHGSVQLTEEGARVKHAWVELPTGYIWEPQTGQHLTHEGFQMFSPIEEHRYTVEEAAIMVARVGKHGPWTDEERASWIGRRTSTNPKDWAASVAEQEPSAIYPWLYEKFGGKKLQDAPWQERQRVAQEISTRLDQEYNIPSEANEYGVVEIPADYFKDNRDHVYDALDEITGVRHTRPWRNDRNAK